MSEAVPPAYGVYHCPQRGPNRVRRWALVGEAGSENGAWRVAFDLMMTGDFSRGDWQIRRLAAGGPNAAPDAQFRRIGVMTPGNAR